MPSRIRTVLAVSAAVLASACTNEMMPSGALQRVESCTTFCEANYDESCAENWYEVITSFRDRDRCAGYCQDWMDRGELTECTDENDRYVDCLSSGPTCAWQDRCDVELADLTSCFRGWCEMHPERCSGDWPEL